MVKDGALGTSEGIKKGEELLFGSAVVHIVLQFLVRLLNHEVKEI